MNTNTFVVWSWEHRAWWRADRKGYTESLNEAGHYTFDEAADITVGHIPAGEEIAMLYEEAKQRGQPRVYGKEASR